MDEILELGHFIGNYADTDEENFDMLLETLQNGMLLTSAWETVDGEGDPSRFLDDLLGNCEYASFIEMPQETLGEFEETRCGIGFKPDFLEAKGVEPVTYLQVPSTEAFMESLSENEALRDAFRNRHQLMLNFRERSPVLFELLKDEKVRERVYDVMADRANARRCQYELIVVDDPDVELDDDDIEIKEWRSLAPIPFTIADVQTIYVPNTAYVNVIRRRFPAFEGAVIVL